MFSLFTIGCKLNKTLPSAQSGKYLPATFSQPHEAGASVARMHYRDFFKDPQLIRLIDTTLKRNYDLRIYEKMVQNALLNFEVARKNRQPELNIGLRNSGDRYGKYTMTGVGNYDTNLSERVDKDRQVNENFTPDHYLAVESTWEIDIWNKLKNLRSAERAKYLATEEGKRFVEMQLIAEIATLYFELQAQDDELEAIEANIKLQQSALDVVQELKKVGRANELAVKQFEAQLLNTLSMQNQIIIDRQKFLNRLRMLSGIIIEPIKVDDNLFTKAMDSSLTIGSLDDLVKNRPDIRQQLLLLEESGYYKFVAQAQQYPALAIRAYGGFNAFNAALFFAPASLAYGLLANLTAPIYQQKKIKTRIKQADNTIALQLLEYQKLQQQAFVEVETHLFEIEYYRKKTQIIEQEVNTLKQAVEISDQLYLNGYASYLELIVARKDVLRSQLELIIATKDRKIARLNLYRSLGGGGS
jgi:outer membrane protein TolC